MEEIYDKDALRAGLESIEKMTVGEIRSCLHDDEAFLVYGDSHWAILKRHEKESGKIMTIEEYKKKFIELFKQLEDEHGPTRGVEIWKEEIAPNLTMCEIKITF